MKEIDLLRFQKPGRYLGKEWNLNFKKPATNDLRVCLCFPEIYEVGMSNLGYRIIYDILNSIEKVSCERCFMPDKDLEEYFLKNGECLFSIETKTDLKDFDILAFSINYELNFVNFLKILRMGHVNLRKDRRTKPLVIVGGLNNPEPIADFVDLFFLGEFEDVAASFMEKICYLKKNGRKETLLSLTDTHGVYVPEFYYQDTKGVKPSLKNIPFPIKRAFCGNINKHFYPYSWLVPYISVSAIFYIT